MTTIGHLRTTRDVDGLIECVNNYAEENRRLRLQAARVLGEIGDPRSAEALARLLRHRDTRTADVPAIATALRQLGPTAFTHLFQALFRPGGWDHKDATSRTIHVLQLAWREDTLEQLTAALGSPDPASRTIAAEALGRFGDKVAAGALAEVLLRDPHKEDGDYGGQISPVRDAAAVAIRRLGAQREATAILRRVGGDEAKWAQARIARARLRTPN